VSAFFNDERNIETLELLRRLGVRIENPDFAASEREQGSLSGMTLVITGTLPVPRKEAEQLVEAHGGHVSSSVSASTDYLIIGENPGSKLAKAENLGITTITYDRLLELLAS
jgi:DNA ligase (NAD+)